MRFDCVLFDLDGTLTDSAVGITNAVMRALEKSGVRPPCRDDLKCLIGPPLKDSFLKYFDMSESQAKDAVEYFREYYSVRGIFENSVYPGIPQLLTRLRDRDLVLVVASSKPETFTIEILKYFGLDTFFDYIAGSSFDGSLSNKSDLIRYAVGMLGQLPVKPLMVGDRFFDIAGAHKQHMPCAAVTWGYGSREELAEHGADFLIDNVLQLEQLILN